MIKNIVFDIGGVLVDFNPRYLYRTILDDNQDIEHLLTHICTPEWNHTLDLGRSWDDASVELKNKYPEKSYLIDLYWERWLDMFSGPIHETVDILMDVKRRGYPVYALSNWNDKKFVVALKEFPFLGLFDGRIVSGEVKLAKPDPAIYKLLLESYRLNPRETLFIDDLPKNIQAARDLGFEAIQFISPRDLEERMTEYGIFPQKTESDMGEHDESVGCGRGCSCHSR
ncbi:MAG TPA: HAD family phosphatase [Alphaproteobacteria bacterium]|nr:HAD family phosphatase [Alphaproteobacteria bacterium]